MSAAASVDAAQWITPRQLRFSGIVIELYDCGPLEFSRKSARGSGGGAPAAPSVSVRCDTLDVTLDRFAAIYSGVRIERAVLSGVEIALPTGMTYSPDAATAVLGGGWLNAIGHPVVDCHDVRLRWKRDPRGPGESDALHLSLSARRSIHDDRAVDLEWTSLRKAGVSGKARWYTDTGAVTLAAGSFPWLNIDDVRQALGSALPDVADVDQRIPLPGGVTLDGQVRLTQWNVEPDASGRLSRVSAAMEVRHVELSVPAGEVERSMDPAQRYLRLSDVGGVIELPAPGKLRYTLTGTLEGASCTVIGSAYRDAAAGWRDVRSIGFDCDVTVTGASFPDPADPRAIRLMEAFRPIANLYRDYNPTGPFDLTATVVRSAGAESPVLTPSLRLDVRGAAAVCRFFPYPVEELWGTVEFTPIGILIDPLTGRHGATSLSLSGWLTGSKWHHACNLSIRADDVVLDRELRAASPPEFQRAFDEFSLAGVTDLTLSLTRPEAPSGERGKWRTVLRADMTDVAAAWTKFPYRIEHVTGACLLEKGCIRFDGVRGVHGPAAVTVGGSVTRTTGSPDDIRVLIQAANVPCDDDLLAALPDESRRAVEALEPSGVFDASCTLSFSRERSRIEPIVTLRPRDVVLRPRLLRSPLICTGGEASVADGQVELRAIAVRIDETDVTLNGRAAIGGRGSVEIVATAAQVMLDDDLIASLAPDADGPWRDWRIETPVGVTTTLRADPEAGRTLHHEIALTKARVTHPALPHPLEDVNGRLTVSGAGVEAKRLVAKCGTAAVETTFTARPGTAPESPWETRAEVRADGVRIDDELLAALPERTRAVFREIRLPDGVDLRIDELRIGPAAGRPEPQISLRGTARASRVGVAGGGVIADADLSLSFEGAVSDAAEGCLIGGRLASSSASLLGHPVQNLTADWQLTVGSGGGPVLFRVTELAADVHGGMIEAEIELSSEEGRTLYDVRGAARDLDVASYLTIDRRAAGAQPPEDVRGVADARVRVSGLIQDRLSRRGSGTVEIRDAYLYRLPVLMAILQVFQLRLPDRNAFDEAAANFLLTGNVVQFEDVRLTGAALKLRGKGTMTLPGRKLDLYLAAWQDVPVITRLTELHVTGSPTDPDVDAGPLRFLEDLVDSLTGKP